MSVTVTSRTRAPGSGRLIYCPHCNTWARVYHFAWSALSCRNCGRSVPKTEWNLEAYTRKSDHPEQPDQPDQPEIKTFPNRLTRS